MLVPGQRLLKLQFSQQIFSIWFSTVFIDGSPVNNIHNFYFCSRPAQPDQQSADHQKAHVHFSQQIFVFGSLLWMVDG